MSALPDPALLEPWASFNFTPEEMAALAQATADLEGGAHHSPGTASSITSHGSASSDATAVNTPQSASTSSTGLRRAVLDSSSHRESAGSEQQEGFSKHLSNEHHAFACSPQVPSANSGSAGVDDLLPDLVPGHLDTQLAGASSSTAQSGHGFSDLLPGNLLQSLFSEGDNSEAPSTQLDCYMSAASCPEQYQHSAPQVPPQTWEQVGGPFAYGQTRNHYADDFPINRWFGNELTDPLYQFSSQLPMPCAFHIPGESHLTIEPSQNIELNYNVIGEKEMIQRNPSNSPISKDSITRAFEDVQPQPESIRQPVVKGLSGPIRTKVNSKNPQKGSHKRMSESRSFAQRQKPKNRGAFTDPVQRLETGETRKRGACIRCRMQRIRCYTDPNDADAPCCTCQGIACPQSKLPCLRYKITETALFDKGSHPQFMWSRRWKEMRIVEIQDWASSEVKTVELTQDVGNAVYNIYVRQFVPVEGDTLEKTWKTNGKQLSYKCSAYAIINMEETGRQLTGFVEDQIKTSIEYFIGESDELLRCTYDMALEHSEKAERDEERRLMRSVLKLWVAIRMESRSERICGEETLGMLPQTFDPAAKSFNQVLLPPVMSAQIELIMTATVLQPLKKTVLVQLQELIIKNKTRSWFTIYLCLFVLLHSCALLTSFENMRAKRHGLQSRYVYEHLVKELHNGAKILLAYFHYCNKGSFPFAIDWTIERNIKLAELNPDQLRFLTKTAQLVEEKATLFSHIAKTGEFEHEFFFLSQLYNETWQPL